MRNIGLVDQHRRLGVDVAGASSLPRLVPRGPSWLSALMPVTVEATVEECQTCDGEGAVRVGSGHNDREVPCDACTVAVEDEYGRELCRVPAVAS